MSRELLAAESEFGRMASILYWLDAPRLVLITFNRPSLSGHIQPEPDNRLEETGSTTTRAGRDEG